MTYLILNVDVCSAIASNYCPDRSLRPQLASLVHHFSVPVHQRFEEGLDENGVGTLATAAPACSRSESREQAVSDASRMG